jgi:hypothetical protein
MTEEILEEKASKTIKDFTTVELKVMVYDHLAFVQAQHIKLAEDSQKFVAEINQEIALRQGK